jgi:hypothetical protein
MASQIKGLAQLQQNAGTSRLIAAKAWGSGRPDSKDSNSFGFNFPCFG